MRFIIALADIEFIIICFFLTFYSQFGLNLNNQNIAAEQTAQKTMQFTTKPSIQNIFILE